MSLTDSLTRLDDLLHRGNEFSFAKWESSDGMRYLSLLECLDFAEHGHPAAPVSSTHALDLLSLRPSERAQRIRTILAQARTLVGASPCPILAVAGLLNAGKTSLVAGFLSPAGRARLLIGQANTQGTHRFVLWLPESWRSNSNLWNNVLTQLSHVFGCVPEELSPTPAVAFEQYNATDQARPIMDSLMIPLIATDRALDQWNVGLMDCPDIQTGIAPQTPLPYSDNAWESSHAVSQMANARAKLLERAIRIASAFVVVTSANALQDTCVETLLTTASNAMPGLKRILAVNRIPRRYSLQEIVSDLRQSYASQSCWRFYMAYHFDGPLARERIPPFLPTPAPDHRSENEETVPSKPATAPTLPVFWRIDHEEATQPPKPIPLADYLIQLGSQLAPSQLAHDLIWTILSNLRQECVQAIRYFHERSSIEAMREKRLLTLFGEVCLSLSVLDSDVGAESSITKMRLQVSREIVNQVAESLERTAPWWALPARRMLKWSEKLRQATTEVTQWMALPSWMSDRLGNATEWVRSRWRSGDGAKVISSQSFFDALARYDLHGDLIRDEGHDRVAMQPQLNQILSRFQSESRTRLDEKELDAYTQAMWQRMGWKQRLWTGLAPAGMLFAPLLAVVMLPMDFGGSTVLVFASMKELLFAGAAGIGMAMLNSDHMPKIAEKEAAWQQVSDLVALTCDAFGVPRPSPSNPLSLQLDDTSKSIVTSQLPVDRSDRNASLMPRFEFNEHFEKELMGCFAGLEQQLLGGI